MSHNIIHPLYDFRAMLECKCHPTTNSWTFILKNITGEKKEELIGSSSNEMDLNLLFPESFRNVHIKFMVDIITEGDKSPHWNAFTNGKMRRNIDIINPITKEIHTVKLGIALYSRINNVFIFNVEMTDITLMNRVINKTGLLTHDLRSILKSAHNTVCEIEKTSNANEHIELLKELLNESLNLCLNARTSFLPENTKIKENSELKKIYNELPKYVATLKNIFNLVDFELFISSNGLLSKPCLDCLLHCLFNITKNAVNANGDKIKISIEQSDLIIISVNDNGEGMHQHILNNFLNRNLPSESSIMSGLYENRGEGFLLAYNEFKTYNGVIEVFSEVGIGTQINLKIPPIKKSDEFVLSINNVKSIFSIKQPKIILFVDDVLLNIKILFYKLLKHLNADYKYQKIPSLSNEQWQEYGMFIMEIDNYAFIFASNGLYGNDIALTHKCNIIITDIHMPLMNGNDMIKSLISNSCKSKIIVNSALSKDEICENSELFELISKKKVYVLEKGNNVDFNLFNL